MNAKLFVADNYQWMTGFIILILILAILLLKKYLAVIDLLKAQVAENRKMSKQVIEFETENTEALEHLNAANERKLKSQHIGHTRMKDEQRLRYNKTMELMARGHISELLKLKAAHTQEIADLKAAHKKTIEGLKGGYTYAIESKQTEYKVAIEERQYQFESKRMQYENFFRRLEQFDNDNHIRLTETLMTILNEFQRNFIQAVNHSNKKNIDNAVKVATKRLERLALDARQELFKIKEEMETIRLIVNADGLQKLGELSDIYDVYMMNFNKMMTEFMPLFMAQKPEKITENEHYLYEAEKAIPAIREALFDLTREEVRAA